MYENEEDDERTKKTSKLIYFRIILFAQIDLFLTKQTEPKYFMQIKNLKWSRKKLNFLPKKKIPQNNDSYSFAKA